MTVPNIHPKLLDKLIKQKREYVKVTKFAELLPMYAEKIIQDEAAGEEYYQLASKHGKLYCAWGINWQTNTPTNYPEEKHSQVGFVNVYINCMSLFGDNCYKFAHEELAKTPIKVHFYDSWNTTFYFLPEEAQEGLNLLEKWFVETHSKCDTYLKGERRKELEKELAELTSKEPQ